jgi:hypothetical protein
MYVLNKFDELKEALSNSKIFRAMIRRLRRESIINTLEAIQDNIGEFTHEEMYTHLQCFKKKLRQNDELTPKFKATAFQVQHSSLCHHSSTT